MDVVFGWLFVSTFFSKVIEIESSLEISVGHFFVLRKHPQLRQCAEKALQKHAYVGARISDQTGVCEGLPHSWGRNQTIESGYGYVKNFHVRISYEPPTDLVWSESDRKALIFPGVFSAGAKIDIHTHVHAPWGNYDYNKLSISLEQEFKNVSDIVYFRISFRPTSCEIGEYDKDSKLNPYTWFDLPHQFSTSNRWKISFVAQRNNTLHILADDEVMRVQKMNVLRLNYVRKVYFASAVGKEVSLPKPQLESFEFTEA